MSVRRRLRLLLLRVLGALLRRIARNASSPTIRRVLVIKPDHLGDVLLLTPALRELRRQWPDAQMTVLIGPWSRVALRHNPDIDVVLICPFPGFTRTARSSLLQPYRLLLKMALLLRARSYDAALIARDDHWWGALLAALAGIPHRIGFALPETIPFLTATLPHSFADHVAQQNLALVETLTGCPAPRQPPMRAPYDSADQAWAEAWLTTHGIVADAPIVAIHPGAGGAAKLWLPERWAEIATTLQGRGLHVIVTGGEQERELIEAIVGQMPVAPFTLIGEATLGQLATLYARCTLVLGVDSGPLHLAVAATVPTLALFGPGDAQRFGPWGDPQRQMVIRSGLWCSPCGVLTACPRGTAPSECMTLITTGQVETAVDQLLARSEGAARF